MMTQAYNTKSQATTMGADPRSVTTRRAAARAIIHQPAAHMVRRPSSADVCTLIDAAGPLALSDIAGGVGVPVGAVSVVVQTMIAESCLREDEWGLWILRRGHRFCASSVRPAIPARGA